MLAALAGAGCWAAATASAPETWDEETRKELLINAVTGFWDSKDVADTTYLRRNELVEQDFADFAFLLAYMPDSLSASGAVRSFFNKFSESGEAYSRALDLSRRYLTAPDSPMRNDELWLIFLDVLATRPETDGTAALRFAYEHERAMKNRVGTPAADLAFVDRNGRPASLSTFSPGSGGILLVFYDPDCDRCHDVLASLKADPALSRLVAEGFLSVLAIDPEEDRDAWETSLSDFPEEWTVGFNTDSLDEREVYDLPSMPVIYLLDPDLKVVAKDISPERLSRYLEEAYSSSRNP